MGERVLIQHMIKGEFLGGQADPDLPAFFAIGTLIVEDIMAMQGSLLVGTAERADLILSSPSATFMADQFDDGARRIPEEGTLITRTTMPGAPTFACIGPPMIDSVGQIVLRMNPLTAEEQ